MFYTEVTALFYMSLYYSRLRNYCIVSASAFQAVSKLL